MVFDVPAQLFSMYRSKRANIAIGVIHELPTTCMRRRSQESVRVYFYLASINNEYPRSRLTEFPGGLGSVNGGDEMNRRAPNPHADHWHCSKSHMSTEMVL